MKIAVRRSLALAIAAGLAVAGPSQAGTLNPGESATVNAGDPIEGWSAHGATLTFNTGSAATSVGISDGSTLAMTGAAATATDPFAAVQIASSSATIAGTRIQNSRAAGLAVTNGISGGAAGTATVTDSSIIGQGIGGYVQGGVLTLSNTTIDGTGIGAGLLPSEISSGLAVFSNSSVNITNGSSVMGDENGIVVKDIGGTPTSPISDNVLTIDKSRVAGRNGSGIVVSGAGIIAPTTVNVLNGSTVSGGNGVIAEAVDGGTLNLNVGASQLQGTLRADATSQLHAKLSNGAVLTGVMTNVTSTTLDTATWNMTGNSTIGALSLGNGTVSLGDGSAFHTLNVAGNFSGADGTIVFNTVLAGDDAATDKLIIGGDTSGTANVRVNNVGGAGAQTDKGIELISVGGASNGQFNLAGRAVGGQYEYFLHKGTGADGNWYLRSQLPTQPDPCVVDPSLPECDPVDPEPVLRPEPGAYLANLQAAQTMFRLGYHDRHAGQNSGRAWARVDGSRNGFDAISRQLDIRGNSQALTVGADLWRHDSGSSVGVMLSSGNASSTSTNELTGYYARGKVKGEALGIYGTWRGGNGADPYAGFYVDGSLQRAQFRNRVVGIGLDTERYDSRAWQGAVETGYAFRVGGANNGGIYLEPQLQVGYSRWDSNRHTEANGTVVSTENANGVFGRAGLRLSGVTRWGNGAAEVQPYLAANWLHTRAESQIRMDDEIADARVPRSRGEFSGGASVKFSNGIGAWGGLSLQKASGYHQTSAQVGVSYSW
ncbi:autotransporter outer membrane beta-barrel domain-containing protein [Stenotrophomonas maltophilia]|uniref:Autotransporter outer membrane beta-barrel domain-containing protein n=1 Tax=Stenotrophomonas maltophilia TaxID=40324 RepID=A0AA40Y7V0_STEMA|nr:MULTISPECIES: autotransporter outer membrane beta-barrel domain-containing protein [Stenotrophomonas]AWB78635.1 autotransporter outer membrane beta-barrel domain-containing protein [Stenotrophomonas maltophilia]KOO70745.1 serine protease [Stenotrophomonas maltophilia]MBH1583666.1 autotransporter outer membrane beta-barrel domain-containing protein [Stenotrophomonas maltophilia]MBH1715774.1 autotransporter outer membrane beta-barrel domain-containing protein [Stenotrophomonas maltophilia]MBH